MSKSLPTLSASQIDTFRDCPRKWAYDKIDRVPRTSSPAAELGGRVHGLLEDWLSKGKLPDPSTPEGAIAIKSIPELPRPKSFPLDQVEKKINLQTDVGISFIGYVDLYLRPEDRPEDHEEHWGPGFKERPLIVDHKTTSSLSWAKSADFLATEDTQMAVYGAWAAFQTKGKVDVDFMWSYTTTKGAYQHRPVRGTALLTDLDTSFSLVLRDGLKIHQYYKEAKEAAEVPANTDVCGKYGGCPYADRCPDAYGMPTQQEATVTGNLAELIKAKKAAQAGASGEPSAVLPPDAPTPTPADKQEALPAKPKKKKKGGQKPKAAEVPAAAATTGTITIIVGAVPAKGTGIKDLGNYLQEQAEKVANANEVPLYNLVEFGKGPALLAAAIRQNPPPPGTYWVLGGLDRPVLIALKDVSDEFLVCHPH